VTLNYRLNFAVIKKADKQHSTEASYENVHQYEAIKAENIETLEASFVKKLKVLLKICVFALKT